MKQRLAILGAGESGTGVALLGIAKGWDVFVSEQHVIRDKFREELVRNGIVFEEGQHSEDKILNASLVVKSPGIPEKVDIVRKIRSAGIPIVDEIEFAFRYVHGSRVIAVTGTNGKTTTTLLTWHLLKQGGLDAALAGNVGFSLARQVAQGINDWYVLEMSSFQLDGIDTFAPDIAILLNITPDHLDRYNYELANYVASKFRLIRSMRHEQHFVYYADDTMIDSEIRKHAVAPKKVPVSLGSNADASAIATGTTMSFLFGDKQFEIRQEDTTLRGPHNLINTMAAVSGAVLAGVPVEAIREGLRTFVNAPHRLESVGTIKGIEFINDSKATNVDSVVYALGSFHQPIVWIAGGIDKGNDYHIIKAEVRKKVKTLICLGKDNSKLKDAFDGVVPKVMETQNVKELVRMALEAAASGDVVLLSPACASFDLFKNYEDRGDQFRSAVKELKEEIEKQPI